MKSILSLASAIQATTLNIESKYKGMIKTIFLLAILVREGVQLKEKTKMTP